MPTLIFVHGACVRDAPWWWSQMTEPLAGHGIASVAVPLPSCGETGDGLGDLYADVDAARAARVVDHVRWLDNRDDGAMTSRRRKR